MKLVFFQPNNILNNVFLFNSTMKIAFCFVQGVPLPFFTFKGL